MKLVKAPKKSHSKEKKFSVIKEPTFFKLFYLSILILLLVFRKLSFAQLGLRVVEEDLVIPYFEDNQPILIVG